MHLYFIGVAVVSAQLALRCAESLMIFYCILVVDAQLSLRKAETERLFMLFSGNLKLNKTKRKLKWWHLNVFTFEANNFNLHRKPFNVTLCRDFCDSHELVWYYRSFVFLRWDWKGNVSNLTKPRCGSSPVSQTSDPDNTLCKSDSYDASPFLPDFRESPGDAYPKVKSDARSLWPGCWRFTSICKIFRIESCDFAVQWLHKKADDGNSEKLQLKFHCDRISKQLPILRQHEWRTFQQTPQCLPYRHEHSKAPATNF